MESGELKTTVEMAMLDPDDPALSHLDSAVSQLIDYVTVMHRLPVEGVEPTTHALSAQNRLRADQERPSSVADTLLAAGADLEDRFIAIPNVL